MESNLIGRKVLFDQLPNKNISSKNGTIVAAATEGAESVVYVEIHGTGHVQRIIMASYTGWTLLPEGDE